MDFAPLSPDTVVSTADGVAVAVYEFGGSGPPLLLVHATGFCGATLAPLAGRLGTSWRSLALDERGHGASGRPPGGDFDWRGFARDVLGVVDGLGLERPLGFGHSCGGAALLLAEEERPGTFAGLYLFEPVVNPAPAGRKGSAGRGPHHDNPLSVGARKRRRRFASAEEAYAHYAAKPPLDALEPDALVAYVANGFRPDPAGGIILACAPEDEAEIYAWGFDHDAAGHLECVACPVTLACGSETDAFNAPALERLAEGLPAAGVVEFAGLGHFGPMERPDVVAASVRAAFDEVRPGDTAGA